jgi:hypothetical protein
LIDRQFLATNTKVASCGPGDCFGEVAVVMNKRRTATARVGTAPAFLATLDKTTYRAIFKSATSELDSKIRYLGGLLPTLGQPALIALSYEFLFREFTRGHCFYH